MKVTELTFKDLDREVLFHAPAYTVDSNRVCRGKLKGFCPSGDLIIETHPPPKYIRHLIDAAEAWFPEETPAAEVAD